MPIKLELDLSEVNAILQILGDLPTKPGAWPLIVKIREQADPQVPVESVEDVESEEVPE